MITTTLTVWCDYCANWVYLAAVKKAKANKEIKQLGWKIVKGKHVCPNKNHDN